LAVCLKNRSPKFSWWPLNLMECYVEGLLSIFFMEYKKMLGESLL
jgi:hypothetical protein